MRYNPQVKDHGIIIGCLIFHGLLMSELVLTRPQPGEQVLIIDAGGGTIDISTYNVVSNGPLRAEELYEPKCGSAP